MARCVIGCVSGPKCECAPGPNGKKSISASCEMAAVGETNRVVYYSIRCLLLESFSGSKYWLGDP
jgi:hypothetical protein